MAGRADELAQAIADRLVAMGPVRARAMFSGHGLFLDDVMFGLIVRGTLYFKVGETNRGDYDEARSKPFSYVRGTRRIAMSYMTVPDAALGDGAVLAAWGERALTVARTAKKKKR